ncbi:efflux RND transporter periplasmic adaptor subunit [Paenibacillus herberti]|nr:HlyD family secretion protein [Paenibacillus herberti]
MPREVLELKSEANWKAKKVYVKEGDSVKKDQKLVSYDSKGAERQIKDEQASLQKLIISMEGLHSSYIEASQSGDEISIRRAKREIQSAEIDLGIQQRKIQSLQDVLENNRELVAPFDGIVTKVGATEGVSSTSGGPDVGIYNRIRGLQFEMQVPASIAALLEIGETLDVQVMGSEIKAAQIKGKITEIHNEDPINEGNLPAGREGGEKERVKRVLVAVQEEELKGGERVQVQLSKQTVGETVLVSSKAIHEDITGKYVYTLEERKGPLGNAFYIQRMNVTVADSNDQETAVIEGLYEYDQVIVESSVPLQEGERVRLQ